MSKFERRYSEDQISACVHAHLDRKIRPKRRILELAEAGQLTARDGRTLKPFTMNPLSFNGFITAERKRRRGPKFGQGLDALDRPDDVMEGMRRRMIAVANDELTFAEKQRRGKRDPEHLRQIARLMREVAALPGPKDGRSRQPGHKENGRMPEGESRGGLAGAMLAAHRRESTAPEPPSKHETQAETEDASAHTRINETTEQTEDTSPGPAIGDRQRAEGASDPRSLAYAAAQRSIPQRHV